MPELRRARQRKLVLVTHNPGKLREFREALRNAPVELAHADRTYPELQADTVEEVAAFGLASLGEEIDVDFCLEDSGLFIDALGGFPGVYSAYVYRTIGLKGVLRLLEGKPDRRAHFESVLGLSFGGEPYFFRGEVAGRIAPRERGSEGFGYDPIFIAKGETRTFGEMTLEEKGERSHRAAALRELAQFLRERAYSQGSHDSVTLKRS